MNAAEATLALETAPTETVCREAHTLIFAAPYIGVIRTGVGEGMALLRKARPAAAIDYHFYPQGWVDPIINPPLPRQADRHSFSIRENGSIWRGTSSNPFAAALAALLKAAP